MRVFFVSDLHADVRGNQDAVSELAALGRESNADAVIVAGDVCNGTAMLASTLARFRDAAPLALYVPGNHELWSTAGGGASARARYYRELPEIAHSAGFRTLATDAVVSGDVAFIGTMGWYDYSFSRPESGYSAEALARKSNGGMDWMDRRFVSWEDEAGVRLTDQEVTELLAEDLEDQVASIAGAELRTVVLVTHHLAFAEVTPSPFDSPPLDYFRAFLGSTRFGEIARADPRVRLALAGHVHAVRTAVVDGITVRTCPLGNPGDRRGGAPPSARHLVLEI